MVLHASRTLRALGVTPLFLIFSSALLTVPPAVPAQSFVVIVNASNPVDTIERDHLSQIFLKRVYAWPTGSAAQPIDLPMDAPSRETFSRSVLRKSLSAVRAYWQQQIFSGRDVPPVEKATDAEMIAAIKSAPEAVGYVSAGTVLPPGVRALVVR